MWLGRRLLGGDKEPHRSVCRSSRSLKIKYCGSELLVCSGTQFCRRASDPLAAALGRPIVYIGISFWQSQKRASAGLGMTQHSLQRFSGTSSANATTQDLLPILALTQSVAVKDLAATALRNCEQDTIFLLHGWDAQHYNLVDTRPPMAPQ